MQKTPNPNYDLKDFFWVNMYLFSKQKIKKILFRKQRKANQGEHMTWQHFNLFQRFFLAQTTCKIQSALAKSFSIPWKSFSSLILVPSLKQSQRQIFIPAQPLQMEILNSLKAFSS